MARTMNDEFELFIKMVFPGLNRDSRQFSDLKKTFYAGAVVAFGFECCGVEVTRELETMIMKDIRG